MVKNTGEAKYRIDASNIAQQRIGMMWADPSNLNNYLEANTDISYLLPSGLRTVTQPIPGQFIITITWQQPGEAIHTFTTVANISGG
jgi:type IV pilus assembly protein PilV